MKPSYAKAYFNRAVAYAGTNAFNRWLADYAKAVALARGTAEAYYNQGILRLSEQKWPEAIDGLTTARDMGFDIVAAFCRDYENVEAFEATFEVEVPEDIAAMLRCSSH